MCYVRGAAGNIFPKDIVDELLRLFHDEYDPLEGPVLPNLHEITKRGPRLLEPLLDLGGGGWLGC